MRIAQIPRKPRALKKVLPFLVSAGWQDLIQRNPLLTHAEAITLPATQEATTQNYSITYSEEKNTLECRAADHQAPWLMVPWPTDHFLKLSRLADQGRWDKINRSNEQFFFERQKDLVDVSAVRRMIAQMVLANAAIDEDTLTFGVMSVPKPYSRLTMEQTCTFDFFGENGCLFTVVPRSIRGKNGTLMKACLLSPGVGFQSRLPSQCLERIRSLGERLENPYFRSVWLSSLDLQIQGSETESVHDNSEQQDADLGLHEGDLGLHEGDLGILDADVGILDADLPDFDVLLNAQETSAPAQRHQQRTLGHKQRRLGDFIEASLNFIGKKWEQNKRLKIR